MKKVLAMIIASVLLIATCVAFASCNVVGGNANPIDFGKKYTRGESDYYVFNSDGTGYYEYNYKYGENQYQRHGRDDFVWRKASDGAVYLFTVDSMTYEDHTDRYKDGITGMGIYFSDEFFVYTDTSGGGGYTRKYIKEGSELEKLLED